MKRKARIALIVFLILVMLGGIGCITYPIFASWYTTKHRSEIIVDHQQEIEQLEDTSIASARMAAKEYNRQLASGIFPPEKYEEQGYYDLLNIAGDGIMGYVEIPKISVSLPIYHGSAVSALADGAGHMPQSSLPVGGTDTHTVVTAHTGMASAPMFTDLHQLEIGDLFILTVLGEKMIYQVDQIQTVLPEDVTGVRIQPGQDLATLLTCTPYGVNTHRLLVRGHRIYPSENADIYDQPKAEGSHWMQQYLMGIVKGMWVVVIPFALCIVGMFIYKFTNRRKKKNA